MSYQDRTKYYQEVGFIINQMIEDENAEFLIYRNEEGEWIITKDRPFFSLGYKLEDVIVTQEEEIKKLHNEIASLKTTIGQLMMRQQTYPSSFFKLETCPNCNKSHTFK